MLLNSNEELTQEGEERLNKLIRDFRRLKFRMEKRYERTAADELAFEEHVMIKDAT